MSKLLVSSAALVLALAAAPSLARADTPQSSPVAGNLGVGLEYQIAGPGGVSALYDAGAFHVGGFFGIVDPPNPDNTAFDIGARFFFHIHRSATADFSLGGSVGFVSAEQGPNNSSTSVILEPSFQMRWFAASNFALSFTGGFSIGLDDDKTFSFGSPTGGLVGLLGAHYYFTR